MIQTFAEHAQKELREQMNAVADSLANDSAKTFDEYRHMTGIIHGLAYAERVLIDLKNAAEGAEE